MSMLLKREYVVSVWNAARVILGSLVGVLSTFLGRLSAWLSGVEMGSRSRFYGRATFQKSKQARIQVGDRCTFRSSARSNLVGINRPCILNAVGDAELRIGNDCGFSGTVIGCFSSIRIDDRVRFGANTLITDGDWHPSDWRASTARGIHIEEDAWVGANVIVLKGVRIGKGAVIGAGSVVTKDIPAYGVAGGNPCKVLKKLR